MPRFLYQVSPARPGQFCVVTTELVRIRHALGLPDDGFPDCLMRSDRFVDPASLSSREARVTRTDLLANAAALLATVAAEWPTTPLAELRAKGLLFDLRSDF